jgi:hypothetical protein
MSKLHIINGALLAMAISSHGYGQTCAGMSLGANANLNGFSPFASSAWYTDISAAPLDPNNAAITSASGFAGLHLHHDWSSVAGGNYGIPFVVVDSSTQALVPISIAAYSSESDIAQAPIPITAPIEGFPADCTTGPGNYGGDQHVLTLDRHACVAYETFNTERCSGAWSADQETVWNMAITPNRPYGWTSADAAGLSIIAGLVRYDEVASGTINHALRFTMAQTKNDGNGGYFVLPATHAAGNNFSAVNVEGMRIRLKSSFDISGFSAANQVILTAMKKYGMIVADNGGYFYFQGAPDSRWDDADLANLDSIQSSNFEVVQMTPSYPGYDSATAPTGSAPTINSFTASATTVAPGTPVTLTWATTNDSYDFIDLLGGQSGTSTTFTPSATATYTLAATNAYGRSTSPLTITVSGAPVAATPTFSPAAGTYGSAQSVTVTSADAQLAANTQNSLTGWSTCILPGCDPGGTGTPTATSQTTGNASPSLSGASMLMSMTANTNDTNALWYFYGADCDSCTNFNVDLQFYPPTTAGLAALEFDQMQMNLPLNTEFMWGMQYCFMGAGCPGGHSSWDIWDQNAIAWIDSGITQAPNLGAWNHLQVHNHRVVGDTSSCSGHPCMHYDTFTLNGTLHVLNATQPAGTLPAGWTSGSGFQVQMDIATVSGSTVFNEYIDQASFSETPATLYYTTDGSTPTTGSTVYNTPLTVSTTQTVKALATVSGDTDSAVGSAAYTIGTPPTATVIRGKSTIRGKGKIL